MSQISQMYFFFYRISTQLKYQLPLAMLGVATLAICVFTPKLSGVDLKLLDRSTFITATSSIASIIALFCSISIAWILFISQQNKSERITAYDLLKGKVIDAQQWLLSQPLSDGRQICLSLAFELSKLDMSDLPKTDLGDEYRAYTDALDNVFDSEDEEERIFYLTSMAYFGYIENLLNRIGIISIRQIIFELFIQTLAKGIFLVCLAVLIIVASTFWYSEATKIWLVLGSSFVGLGAVLLFLEV